MTETQKKYIDLNSRLLYFLEEEDRDEDGGECDRLRDELEPLWYAMTRAQIDECEKELEPLLVRYLDPLNAKEA